MQQGYKPNQYNEKPPNKKRNLSRFNIFLLCWLAVVLASAIGISGDVGLLFFIFGGIVCAVWVGIKRRKPKSKGGKRPLMEKEHEVPPVVPGTSEGPVQNQTRTKRNMISYDQFDYVGVKVAGVTYSNGRRQRQTILREIYWHDKAYAGRVAVTLKPVPYQDKMSIEVWANDELIGYVQKELTDYFIKNWDRYIDAIKLEVSGGGETSGGERINYGAKFIARFQKKMI